MTLRHAVNAKREAHETDIAVGARIRELRREAGVSLQDLAAVLGLTYQMIQKYELAKNRVSAGRLAQIAAALDRSVIAFFRPRAAARTPNNARKAA